MNEETAIQPAGGDRNERGQFIAGNHASRQHGLYSSRAANSELAIAVQEKADAIASDLGGAERLSTMQADAVREVSRLSIITDSLGADLLERGCLTPKGRIRAAVGVYGSALDRMVRLMSMLGLARVERHLSPSTVDAVVASVRSERG